MRRALLRPGWLVLHVLVVVALYAMVRLGAWQWGRGVDLGALRNYSYGLEWWAFALLTVVGWVKFCLDETAERPEGEPAAPAPVPAAAVTAVPDDEDDPELAAWNAHLRALAARDAERHR